VGPSFRISLGSYSLQSSKDILESPIHTIYVEIVLGLSATLLEPRISEADMLTMNFNDSTYRSQVDRAQKEEVTMSENIDNAEKPVASGGMLPGIGPYLGTQGAIDEFNRDLQIKREAAKKLTENLLAVAEQERLTNESRNG
jgi:hypothetical protein